MTQNVTGGKGMKIGVLISGSGTNLQAIIDAVVAGDLSVEVALVISSRPDAKGITRAREAGIPVIVLNRQAYANPIVADEKIAHELKAYGCEYVVMAGYMRMVHAPILEAYPDKVVNLHPALLPSFKGGQAIYDAYVAGVKVTGVTVHFANEDYDKGPIIAQRAVRVFENDTLEDLEERIHEVEHELLPETLQLIAEGRVSVNAARTVNILPWEDRD